MSCNNVISSRVITIIFIPFASARARDYYLEDERKLTPGFVFGGVRTKSREEVLQERHIEALKKRATKSQDFLSTVQIALTISTIGLAVVQILMMSR